jgi:hypothetical protein
MRQSSALTQEKIKALLDYDPETGLFRWRVQKSNSVKVGQIAGRLHHAGYRLIMIDYCEFPAHHLAWFYINGRWAYPKIDHRNMCKDANSFANLREATVSQNNANARRRVDNTSGFKGVHRHRDGRYRAQLSKNGRKKHLGLFDTAAAAHSAYMTAAKTIHGEFANAGL